VDHERILYKLIEHLTNHLDARASCVFDRPESFTDEEWVELERIQDQVLIKSMAKKRRERK
jgi:tRNA U34 5-carboxymethylaminomethyl modifying GTPase MnmE/TrmE